MTQSCTKGTQSCLLVKMRYIARTRCSAVLLSSDTELNSREKNSFSSETRMCSEVARSYASVTRICTASVQVYISGDENITVSSSEDNRVPVF